MKLLIFELTEQILYEMHNRECAADSVQSCAFFQFADLSTLDPQLFFSSCNGALMFIASCKAKGHMVLI